MGRKYEVGDNFGIHAAQHNYQPALTNGMSLTDGKDKKLRDVTNTTTTDEENETIKRFMAPREFEINAPRGAQIVSIGGVHNSNELLSLYAYYN